MVLARIHSFPPLKYGSTKGTGKFCYIFNRYTRRQTVKLCNTVIKIIPAEYSPKVGDFVNVRNSGNTKVQLTLIQHTKPITKPVKWFLSYHTFTVYCNENEQDLLPLVMLKPNPSILQFWSDYSGAVRERKYHFLVLSLPTILEFEYIKSGMISKAEVR